MKNGSLFNMHKKESNILVQERPPNVGIDSQVRLNQGFNSHYNNCRCKWQPLIPHFYNYGPSIDCKINKLCNM